MIIEMKVNGRNVAASVECDEMLLDVLRKLGFTSVKRGCSTSNCGLCTVLMNDIPVLSCSVLAVKANAADIKTLEGVREEAQCFGAFLAEEGGDQCGFCSPGFIMNVISLKRRHETMTESEIADYLMGNLCRCTGYRAQMRAVKQYLEQ